MSRRIRGISEQQAGKALINEFLSANVQSTDDL